MELTKEKYKSIAEAQKISDTIGEKMKEGIKKTGTVKEGVNLVQLAKKLAKRKVENSKEKK